LGNNVSNALELRSARSIQEFWMDFLLEEEFSVTSDFTCNFLFACDPALKYRSTDRVAHSVSDKHGEADLVVLLSAIRNPDQSERLALLIEDKITAAFQPQQAERYRNRGNAGKNDGLWDSFLTILVAPQAYIPVGHGFDAAIPFERIKDWLCLSDPARRAFKLRRIDEAISKKNATGVQVVDAEMTAFRAAYYDYLHSFNAGHGTDFAMRPPKDTYYGDSWFEFKSNALPSWSEIRHMASAGNIELIFKDTEYERSTGIAELLEAGMELIRTGKYFQHVTIRLRAPKIAAFHDFDAMQKDVETTLIGAEQLLRLFRRHQARFEEILIPARAKQKTLGKSL
jgi:hypothetical protein